MIGRPNKSSSSRPNRHKYLKVTSPALISGSPQSVFAKCQSRSLLTKSYTLKTEWARVKVPTAVKIRVDISRILPEKFIHFGSFIFWARWARPRAEKKLVNLLCCFIFINPRGFWAFDPTLACFLATFEIRLWRVLFNQLRWIVSWTHFDLTQITDARESTPATFFMEDLNCKTCQNRTAYLLLLKLLREESETIL